MTNKVTKYGEEALTKLNESFLEGRQIVPFVGDVNNPWTILAMGFAKLYPLQQPTLIVDREDIWEFRKKSGILPWEPMPSHPDQYAGVKAEYILDTTFKINKGVLSEQWPDPKNAFQVEVNEFRKNFKVISIFESVLEKDNKHDEKHKTLEETIRKDKINKLLHIDPSYLNTNEKLKLIKIVNELELRNKPHTTTRLQAHKRLALE